VRVLWAPWRLSYIEKAAPTAGCFFCEGAVLIDPAARRDALVLRTTERTVTVMNRFPYANAHVMVAPRTHTAAFSTLPPADAHAISDELQVAAAAIERIYRPQGMNVGMNLGRVGGAGVADHLHWHLVPRWEGDTNFMPLLADTKVIPQHIEESYDRLLPAFETMKR